MATPPSPTTGPSSDDLVGRLLAGRYRLNRPIASGGMAQVWEATDEVLTRRVAVKVLHPHLARDESFVQRFRGEAIAAARLAHPSIVSVYDTVREDDLNAIVMELVSGTTMRADLDQHGPLQLDAVLAIGTQVADALGSAHASGLVHRDVKPANILLSGDGRVLVADFGIAKAAEGSDLTHEGSMLGTAKYLAPEQVEGGRVDGRTDLYALGVVLYEALTGTAPFTADTDAGTALARLHRDPVPPRRIRPDIPPSVEAVVLRALARRPEDRFESAAAMRRALLAAGADPAHAPVVAQAAVAGATGERPAVRPDAPPLAVAQTPATRRPEPRAARRPEPAPAPAPRRRRGWLRWLVALVLVALAGGAAMTVLDGIDGSEAGALAVVEAIDFDPGGGDGENPDLLGQVLDGDDTTAWRTERYDDPDVEAYKGGVGLVLRAEQAADLERLELTTPDGGWTARVYVTTTPAERVLPGELTEWGDPVATLEDVPDGVVEADLDGRPGDLVLVWFTDVGPTHVAQVASAALHGS